MQGFEQPGKRSATATAYANASASARIKHRYIYIYRERERERPIDTQTLKVTPLFCLGRNEFFRNTLQFLVYTKIGLPLTKSTLVAWFQSDMKARHVMVQNVKSGPKECVLMIARVPTTLIYAWFQVFFAVL